MANDERDNGDGDDEADGNKVWRMLTFPLRRFDERCADVRAGAIKINSFSQKWL